MNKLILTVSILLPSATYAGGYFIPNETARELGVSESAVADQHGAEAIFLNVAALAGQFGVDVSANGEVLVNQTDWAAPTMGTASLDTQATYPPAGAISYGQKLDNGMAWGIGAGVSVPGGGSLKWPAGWQGQEAAQSVTQEVFLIGAGAAFQPMPYLKVGASVLRYNIVEDLHQSINYLDHYGDAGVSMSGGGNAFGVGVEFQIPRTPLTLGANYKHSADVTLKGDAHFTDVPSAFQPMIHDQGVTEKLTVPNEVIAGVAWEVAPGSKLYAAYTFERWSVYRNDTLVGADGFMVTIPRDYRNAHVLRAGGEWNQAFVPALTLRAGALRNISNQPTNTISPTLSDASSWAFSVGAGYRVDRGLRIDLGYQHAFFDTVTASGNAFPGTYNSVADLVSLGLNWRTDLGFLRGR